MEEYLCFAKEVAYNAGEIMLRYFNSFNEASYKSNKTIVTKADIEINEYLIKKVKDRFPTHSVDGEERHFGKSKWVWVCDPIDGTSMYSKYIPIAVFSLALVIDGDVTVGVVYDPFTDSMYHAIKGKGAYKNDQKIKVNDLGFNDRGCCTDLELWPSAEFDLYYLFDALKDKTSIESIGTVARASMCVATGDFSLVVFPGTKHANCDVAASKIIVEEAGGKVTDLFGNDQKYDGDLNGAIISNEKIHGEILQMLKSVK